MRFALGLLLSVPVVTACAPRRGSMPDPSPAEASEATFISDVPLRVESRFYGDVVISLDRGGVRTRLTTLTGNTSRDMVIPKRFLIAGMPFRLVAEGIGATSGGERVSTNTGDLLVRPGQRIVWQLETQLQRSSVGVY